jgi:hypothetical protein
MGEVLTLQGNMGNDISIVHHSPYRRHFDPQEHGELLVADSWATEGMDLINIAILNLELQAANKAQGCS